MQIALTGGGTGGHVLPCLAIIAELRKRAPHTLFYIGGKNSIEEKICGREGIEFHGIHAGKLRRYFDLKNFIDAFKTPLGIFEAYRILRTKKPDLVFAKGGYVSVPVVLAARLLKIPVWLHESDVTPGLSTKICSRFAKKIFLSFQESTRYFHNKNVEVVGNPIRTSLLNGSKEIGYKITGFTPEKPVTLIIGGSTGAQSLNRLIEKILPDLLKVTQVVHITGAVSFRAERSEVEESVGSVEMTKDYKSFEFLNEDLAHIYAITNLAVSRAGSGSIFEFLALGMPMILIPLPLSASRGDQIENAEIFTRNGWAYVLDQDTLKPQELLQTIKDALSKKALVAHGKDPAYAKATAGKQSTHFIYAAQKIADEMVIFGK